MKKEPKSIWKKTNETTQPRMNIKIILVLLKSWYHSNSNLKQPNNETGRVYGLGACKYSFAILMQKYEIYEFATKHQGFACCNSWTH